MTKQSLFMSLPNLLGKSMPQLIKEAQEFNKFTNSKTGNINHKFNKRTKRGKR
jgi:hypothetical protein